MAITVTQNLTDVSLCESTTGWAGGISQLLAQNTNYIQGSYALACWIDNTTSAIEYYTITAANFTNKNVYVWMMCTGRVDTQANGGYRIVLYTDASNYAEFYVGGNDTHGTGWNLLYCNASATGSLVHSTGTFNPASVTSVGIRFKTITAGTKQGQTYMHNCFWDAVRYGTGLTITSGTTDQITLENILTVNESYAYGIIRKIYGAYVLAGNLVFGSESSGSIDFVAENEVILFPNNPLVLTADNTIKVLGNVAGTSNFSMNGCFIKANYIPAILDVDGANLDTISILGNTLVNVGTINFAAGQTINTNVFSGCGKINSSSAEFHDNTVKETVNTDAGLLWNDNIDPDGSIFLSNTLGAAIEMPSSTNSPFDYDNLTFSGNTKDVYNSSGSPITVNLLNGTNATTYEGSLVTFVANPVTLSVTVKDINTGTEIEDARVLVEVANGTNFPYQASVTITRTGDVATVSHATHGLITGNKVRIVGANQYQYNGVKEITYIDASSYSFPVTGTPDTPATGTITATFVLIDGDTDEDGYIYDTRTYTANQLVTGRVRNASSSYYKTSPISGTVNKDSGLALIIQMIPDS